MEPFETYLRNKGVSKNAVKALTTEKVVSKLIFKSLKEHIIRLLKCEGMSIGSLWELWSSFFGEDLYCAEQVNYSDPI